MRNWLSSFIYLGALACITVSALGFILLRFVPPSVNVAWLLPLTALLIGLITLIRRYNVEHALVVSLAIFAMCWGASQYVWPRTFSMGPSSGDSDSSPLVATTVYIHPEYRYGAFSQKRQLFAPRGTKISVFRNALKGVRWLAFSPAGQLFASLPHSGEVVKLVDDDDDGYAESLHSVATGLDKPHGLAFDDQDLVVAGEMSLYRLVNAGRKAVPEVNVLSRDLPGPGGHWTRTVVVDDKRRIFVSAGSSCNTCEEKDRRRATVMQFSAQGGKGKLFATGLRNSVGLAIHPRSHELWGSDNARDMLGDDLPPDEINLIREGLNYGWPYCYGENIPDPEFNQPSRCLNTQKPKIEVQAHSAPLGIAFGKGLDAVPSIESSMLIAYHGSWNRSIPTGYKIVTAPFSDHQPQGNVNDLITGWLIGSKAWGRPVALAVGPDGALYISDDRADAIYRVVFTTRQEE